MATDYEKLEAAMAALRHVLKRINLEPEVAHLMGHATTTYELVCQAVATCDDLAVEEVEEKWEPCPPLGQHRRSDLVTMEARHEAASLASLDPLQRQLCECLSVAPYIATQIIQFTQRYDFGRRLWVLNFDATEDEREAFACQAHTTFLDWALRGQRRPQKQLAA